MIVTFQHTETKRRHSKGDLTLFVEYDNTPNIIKKIDMYDDIDNILVFGFCEFFDRYKKQTLDSYRINVDIMYQIYKESITKNGLTRIIRTFPRRSNGYFKKGTQVIIARSLNAKYDKNNNMYNGNCLVAYAKTRNTIVLKYKSVSFI